MIDRYMEQHLQRPDRPVHAIDRLRIYLLGPGNLLWTGVVIILSAAYALGLGGALVDYVRFPFGATARVTGTVIDSGDTNTEINERTVSWVSFAYDVEGQRHTAVAYGSEYYPAENARVPVDYLVDAPQRARIAGQTRTTMLGPVVLFFVAAALVLMPFAAWRSATAHSWVTLLRRGRAGRARLVSREPTSVKVNDEPVYELLFEYRDERGAKRQWRTRRTEFGDITDDDEELVLYDPSSSTRLLFMDELPVAMAPGPGGSWQFVGSKSVLGALLRRLVLPAILIALGVLL